MASTSTASSVAKRFIFDSPGLLLVRIALFLIGTGLALFDTYTDWELVVRFKKHGFNHPLLATDVNWLRAFYLFATIGTVLAAITLVNESIDLLHSIRLAWRKKYGCKSCRSRSETAKVNGREQIVQFEMENCHRKTTLEMSKEKEEQIREFEDEETVINDACKCCYHCGWNFTTRAETLGILTVWFEDVPMLTLAVLYAYSQSTCKLPEIRDVSGDMFNVGLSAVASTASVAFRVARSVLRLCISVGLRIKSKKDASKLKVLGKCFAKFLPEKGDAIYPQGTCSQFCIIPFFFSIILDFVLLFMGFVISLVIWFNYASLLRTPNFDDSLAIYRFTYQGTNVHLLNISNNIIPASNGSFISFETVLESGGTEVTHCLSEFKYREKDFDIFLNTIEVLAVSDEGVFCATKSGYDVNNFDLYSRCTLYYTHKGYVLFYGFTNRITGKITRFDSECIVVKDRLPTVHAGPDIDRSIEVEKNIDRTHLPSSSNELLILFVSRKNPEVVLFTVSVADIVRGHLDETYGRTFEDRSNETNVTYLIRLQYNYPQAQFIYNVNEVLNYPPARFQSCQCTNDRLTSSIKFHQIGFLLYGYYNQEIGKFQPLLSCSQIPLDKIIPQYNVFLMVGCYCRTASFG